MRSGLRERRSFGGFGPDKLVFMFFIAMLFFTVHNLFFGRYNLIELKKIKQSLTDMEARLENLKKENAKLEEELELIEKDKDFYLEKLVREKMQLQKPEEKIILFKE